MYYIYGGTEVGLARNKTSVVQTYRVTLLNFIVFYGEKQKHASTLTQ